MKLRDSRFYNKIRAGASYIASLVRRKASEIPTEDRSGLYLTVSLHLAVLIILLVSQIGSALSGDNSFLLDFSAAEEAERTAMETEFKESISDRLDRLIGALPYQAPAEEEIRNIAVDAGSGHLKDDRNTDAGQLYRDAERLDRSLKSGAFAQEEDDPEGYAAPARPDPREMDEEETTYTGPSVVSYSLDGRKAITLSVPAYRCLGGGDVTVRITVDQSGTVMNVEIMDENSSQDRCLREYAKRAARLSRFTASVSAHKRQFGEITYRFIAQK